MSDLCRLIWCGLIGLIRPRAALQAEIVVLRHQLNVLRRKSPKRVAFSNIDRLVFVGFYLCMPETSSALIRSGNRLTSAHYDRAGLLRLERSDLSVQIGQSA